MLYKINKRGIIQIWNKIELRFLCTARSVVARNMHNKFGVSWTYGDKVTLRTRNDDHHAADAPDQGNSYISPSQATQKLYFLYSNLVYNVHLCVGLEKVSVYACSMYM